MRRTIISVLLASAIVGGCSSGWSEAELDRVQQYCVSSAGSYADRCSEWVLTIQAESDCDPIQARGVVTQIIAEYNGAPPNSVADNYRLQGCEYVGR